MRSVRGIGGVLAIGAPALLAAMVGVGCRGHEAAVQEVPGHAQPVGTVVEDAPVPGDQRLPGGAPTVTTATTRPIGRSPSPVPGNRTQATRPPVVFPTVQTTTTTGLLTGG
jgi:hypothetical protein